MNDDAKKCLDLILDNPYKIGHWVGFNDLTALHNDWIKMFMQSEEDETLLAHRGSYKTTCLSVAIALLIVIKPNKNIIFIRKTDTDVIEIIEQVKKILLSAELQYLVKKIYGHELKFIKDNASEIDTNLKTVIARKTTIIGNRYQVEYDR